MSPITHKLAIGVARVGTYYRLPPFTVYVLPATYRTYIKYMGYHTRTQPHIMRLLSKSVPAVATPRGSGRVPPVVLPIRRRSGLLADLADERGPAPCGTTNLKNMTERDGRQLSYPLAPRTFAQLQYPCSLYLDAARRRT